METLEAIGKRVSLKNRISPTREVEQEKIIKILDAARLAPSAKNTQPWRFIVLRNKQLIKTLVSEAFSEGNHVMSEAPVIIIACAKPGDDIIRDGKEYYLYDVGMAVENMLLAATDLGLVTHPATGVNEDELKRILDIPDEVRFVVATPVAYPSKDSYEEAAQERLTERTRKGLQEVVYMNSWGKPF